MCGTSRLRERILELAQELQTFVELETMTGNFGDLEIVDIDS